LSIKPRVSDPRLNTAKFVFQEEGKENEMHYIIVLLVAIVFSFWAGLFISFYWSFDTDDDSYAKKAVNCTALFLLFIYCLLILIFVVVVTLNDDVRPGNQVCLYILYGYQSLLFTFSVISLGYRAKEPTSTLFFYLLSFVTCFHGVWVSLGVFSNPLWALPILLTILTTIILIFMGIYYIIKNRSNRDEVVLFFFVMFMTYLFYLTFTWISARFFFTNEFVFALIQTLLAAVLSPVAVLIKERHTD
jgi:hypothetical protein